MNGDENKYLGMSLVDLMIEFDPIFAKPRAKYDLTVRYGAEKVTQEEIDRTISLGLVFPAGLVYVVTTLRSKRRDEKTRAEIFRVFHESDGM